MVNSVKADDLRARRLFPAAPQSDEYSVWGQRRLTQRDRGGRGDRLLPENVVSSLTHKEQVLQVKIPKGFVLFC